jgi:hypothetical protein
MCTSLTWGIDRVAREVGPCPAVLYALGGGRGHLTRAVSIAQRLAMPVTIVHSCGSAESQTIGRIRLVRVAAGIDRDGLRRLLQTVAPSPRLVVIDTFPAGIAHELSSLWRDTCALRVLVRRFVRPGSYPDYERHAGAFDVHWEPYPAEECEWEGDCSGAHVGWILRPVHLQDGSGPDVQLVGHPRDLPIGMRVLLPADTHVVDGPFDSLARARRTVCIGAGYNLAYELKSLGMCAGFVALERRFDDQYRRAARAGTPLVSSCDLQRFLAHNGQEACHAA